LQIVAAKVFMSFVSLFYCNDTLLLMHIVTVSYIIIVIK